MSESNLKEKNISLINEFREQREKLTLMVSELEKLKNGIEKIFPDTLDARYSRFLEEKIKAVTELFKAILDMRKEIIKNIKDEIDLRNKYEENDDNDKDDMSNLDIRSLVRKIEQFNKDNNFLMVDSKEKKLQILNESEETEEVVNE